MKNNFKNFLKSKFNLEIWAENKIIFRSKKKGIKGFLDFIKKPKKKFKNLIVFDTKVGNAVALLCVFIKAKEVYGKIGSKIAKKTLKKFKIKFYFLKTIPFILNKEKKDFCPLEKLSILKNPKAFYKLLKERRLF